MASIHPRKLAKVRQERRHIKYMRRALKLWRRA